MKIKIIKEDIKELYKDEATSEIKSQFHKVRNISTVEIHDRRKMHKKAQNNRLFYYIIVNGLLNKRN